MRGMSLVRHAFLQFKVGSYQLWQKINTPLSENFTSQYRTWWSIRSCWKTNCYKHCLRVAYCNYCLCKMFHLDARSAARAGMIHDLFLYDWHTHAAQTGERFHGLKHPEKAYRNAKKYFPLNQIEVDIIRTHMWPVTFRTFPRTREGWVTTLTDKYCSLLETGRRK